MRSMNRTVLLFVCCLAVCATSRAEDKAEKATRPIGLWAREAGTAGISFDIKADNMIIKLKDGEQSLTISAAYSVTGDTLFGIITKVERAGIEGGPNKGDLFRFNYKTKKDVLTVSELKTSPDSDEARRLVEGDYKKK
jgi:hypothetical protein